MLSSSLLGTLCSYRPFSCPPSGSPEPPAFVACSLCSHCRLPVAFIASVASGTLWLECQAIRGYPSLSTPTHTPTHTGLSWRPSQKPALSGPPAICISARSCCSGTTHPPWRKTGEEIPWVCGTSEVTARSRSPSQQQTLHRDRKPCVKAGAFWTV